MRKLWMLAAANLKKAKSASVTLAVMFLVAALLFNVGLLVTFNYGSFFTRLKEELNPSDALILVPDALYGEEAENFFRHNEHITQLQHTEALILGARIRSQGEDKGFNVFLFNMDAPRDMSQWKFVGDHLPAGDRTADEMPVYAPDIIKAVSGYQLGDPITLRYTDEGGADKTLTFTVKGYVEDLYFGSNNAGGLGFYLPGDTYDRVAGVLNSVIYREHIMFMNLDDIANASKVESGLRTALDLHSSSLMSADISAMLWTVDIDMLEGARTSMASMVSAMMVLFALVIVVVCLLVVRFRIVNNIEDNLLKIGSLKSAGYTSRQIRLYILMQFGLIAGVGSLIGIALSYLTLPAISLVFEQQSGLRWTQGFDGGISLIVLTVILGFLLLFSQLASRRVKRMSPVHALRGTLTARQAKRNVLPLDKTAGPLPVALAFKSALQGFKQSVMIFVITAAVAFAGVFGIIMYYNTSVDTKTFAEVPGSEIANAVVSLDPQADHTEIIQTIKNMPHVRKAQYVDESILGVDGNDISATVMADYADKETNVIYDGRYPEKTGEIALSGVLAERLGKKVSDTVAVRFGGRAGTFTVVGLYSYANMDMLSASVLRPDYERLNPDFKPQTLYVYLDKGTDAAAFVRTLEDSLDKELCKGIMDMDKAWAEGMASYQGIIEAMGLVMLVITLMVIALVLYFVIGSSVVRRKRELGIQKAVGFSTLQLMQQMAVGFAVPLTLGVAAGCLLGAFYTNTLMTVVMRTMGVMKANFIVDALWVAAFGAATAVFAYVLSLLVTRRIRKISAYALVTE